MSQLKHSMKKTRQEVYDLSVDAVEYVKEHGTQCLFSAMDATRTEPEFLYRICRGTESAGADIINIPDTVGIMAPSKMFDFIKRIKVLSKFLSTCIATTTLVSRLPIACQRSKPEPTRYK